MPVRRNPAATKPAPKRKTPAKRKLDLYDDPESGLLIYTGPLSEEARTASVEDCLRRTYEQR